MKNCDDKGNCGNEEKIDALKNQAQKLKDTMKISYDYEEFIQELKEELADEILLPGDTIYVLREDKTITVSVPLIEPFVHTYSAITDWYYGDEEEIDYDDCESAEEIEKLEKRKEMFLKDNDNLIKMSVKDCLAYMESKNRCI